MTALFNNRHARAGPAEVSCARNFMANDPTYDEGGVGRRARAGPQGINASGALAEDVGGMGFLSL